MPTAYLNVESLGGKELKMQTFLKIRPGCWEN